MSKPRSTSPVQRVMRSATLCGVLLLATSASSAAAQADGGQAPPGEQPADANADVQQSIDPRVAAVIEQQRPRFERIRAAQEHYVRRVCSLNPEQIEAVGGLAKRTMEASLRAVAEAQIASEMVEVNGRKIRRPAAAGRNAPPPVDEAIVRAVLESPDGGLSPAQRERLREEVERRAAFRKRVAVRALAGVLEESLFLSGRQRERLEEALREGWDPYWAIATPKLIAGGEYLPPIPDGLVLPLLDKDQAVIWASLPKIGFKTIYAFSINSTNDPTPPWTTGVALPVE